MAGSPSIAVKVLADLKGFTTAVTGAGTHVNGVATKMRSAFSGVTGALNQTGVLGPFSGVLDGINSSLDALDGKGKNLSKTFIGVGTAAAGVGAGLTAFGSKDQAAMQQLQQAVENTGASYEDFGSSVEEAISHQEKFGHTANETEDALRLLTNATHDPQKALDLLGEASDVAASKHEDLSTAATQLGKVYNGNTKLLKEYGIIIDKTTGLTADGKTAVQALAEVTAGQASRATDTFTGKLDGLKAKLEDQVALFGQKYGPAITAAGIGIAAMGSAAQAASAAFDAMGLSETFALGPLALIAAAVVAAYFAVVLLYQKWDEVWTFIGTLPWYEKAAVLILAIINPVTLLIGIAAALAVYWDDIWSRVTGTVQRAGLIIGAVLAGIETFFQVVFDGIATIVDTWVGRIEALISNLIGWLQAVFGPVAAILSGPFNVAYGLIAAAIQAIENVVGGVAGFVAGAFEGLENVIAAPFRIAQQIIDTIVGDIQTAVDKITGPMKSIIGAAGSVAGGIGNIIGLQHGGIVTHPTLALVGEAGPEAVIPLNRLGNTGGPSLVIQEAHFHDEADVELLMRRTAWAARTQAV